MDLPVKINMLTISEYLPQSFLQDKFFQMK